MFYPDSFQETSNSLSREEFEKKAKELKDAVDRDSASSPSRFSSLDTRTIAAAGCSITFISRYLGSKAAFSVLSFPRMIVVTIFTISGISGSQTSVQTILNVVCAFAICLEITSISFPFGEINWTNFANHGTRKIKTQLPLILKILCAIAVRFYFPG